MWVTNVHNTNSMKQSLSLEANGHPARQGTVCLLHNLKVHSVSKNATDLYP
jgi:hypothetical protein